MSGTARAGKKGRGGRKSQFTKQISRRAPQASDHPVKIMKFGEGEKLNLWLCGYGEDKRYNEHTQATATDVGGYLHVSPKTKRQCCGKRGRQGEKMREKHERQTRVRSTRRRL